MEGLVVAVVVLGMAMGNPVFRMESIPPRTTHYYGDLFELTCEVTVPSGLGEVFLGNEMVMIQPFWSGLYEFGGLCYSSAARYDEWQIPSNLNCNTVESGNNRTTTVQIQMTEDMHSPDRYSDQVQYQCIIHYQVPGYFYSSDYELKSERVTVPIKEIQSQSIAIEKTSPAALFVGDTAYFQCASSNEDSTVTMMVATGALLSTAQQRGDTVILELPLTMYLDGSHLICTDGGRELENKTLARFQLQIKLSTPTSKATTTTSTTTTAQKITTLAPNPTTNSLATTTAEANTATAIPTVVASTIRTPSVINITPTNEVTATMAATSGLETTTSMENATTATITRSLETTSTPAVSQVTTVERLLSTTDTSTILGSIGQLNMTFADTENENKTLLVVGSVGLFKCDVLLNTALEYEDSYDGLTLELVHQNGTTMEDGCLFQTTRTHNLFENAVKSCTPWYEARRSYSARIQFTITPAFLGVNTYRCNLRTQQYSYLTFSWYSSIELSTNPITKLGLASVSGKIHTTLNQTAPTSKAPNIAKLEVSEPDTSSLFTGQTFAIVCKLQSTIPLTVSYLMLEYTSAAPAHTLFEGCTTEFTGRTSIAARIPDCSFLDKNDMTHELNIIVNVTTLFGKTPGTFRCVGHYHGAEEAIYSETISAQTIYNLRQFHDGDMEYKVEPGETVDISCNYQPGELPTASQISLTMSEIKSNNESKLIQSTVLSSNTIAVLRNTYGVVMENITVRCGLINTPLSAIVPQPILRKIRVVTKGTENQATGPDGNGLALTLTELQATNKTLLRIGNRALFQCSVVLDTPYIEEDQYDGLALQMEDMDGTLREDGCLFRTVIPENQKLFESPVRSCTAYNSTRLTYSASVEFTVPSRFVGRNEYRCILREQYYSYWFLSWYSEITRFTRSVTRIGTTLPSLALIPSTIAGFAGERLQLKCTSYGGYPSGEVRLNTTDGILMDITHEQISSIIASVQGVVELALNTTNTSAYCYNTAYPDQIKESSMFIVKTMMLTGNSSIQFNHITTDLNLDCGKEVQSNTELNYHWKGEIIPAYDRHRPQVKLYYSVSRNGGRRNVVCQVSMRGDPARRVINITYQLSYEVASVIKRTRSHNFVTGGSISILFIFLITGLALIYTVTIELIGRRSLRIRPLLWARENKLPSTTTNQTMMKGPGSNHQQVASTDTGETARNWSAMSVESSITAVYQHSARDAG